MLFKNEKSLDEFIITHSIEKAENLFIQIFSGIVDCDYFMKIVHMLKKRLPHAEIIGTTTSGEILEGAMLENGIVVSFSVFESSRVVSQL